MLKVKKSSLGAIGKGKKVLRTTSRAIRKANLASLAQARAKLAADCAKNVSGQLDAQCNSPVSITTVESTETQSLEEEKFTGVSYVEFIEHRYDFRKWGSKTYGDFVHDGHQSNLLHVLQLYEAEIKKKKETGHQHIVALDELPLNTTSAITVSKMAMSVGNMLKHITYKDIVALSVQSAEFIGYSDKEVRAWTLQFMHNEGLFCNVGYSKREPDGLINDPIAMQTMRTWMYNASIGPEPSTSKDFAIFIEAHWGVHITERTAQVWLRRCGFKFKYTTTQEIYNDGHQRPDVLEALTKHVQFMKDIKEECVYYTGEQMEAEIVGARLVDPAVQRSIINFHDECSAHTTERNALGWTLNGRGKLKNKSKGDQVMVAAFVCADIGIWTESMQFIQPGTGIEKDDWWGGKETMAQAAAHLDEFDCKFSNHRCIDVYDNSTGHNCAAVDALRTSVMNIKPGGKNYRPIRSGKYVDPEGQEIIQSTYFEVGDRLQNSVTVKVGTFLSTKDKVWKAQNTHLPGVIIDNNCELLGVAKGMKQMLLERGRWFNVGACAKAKHKTTINSARKSAMEAWRQDKSNYELLQALLLFPTTEELTEQLDDIHCICVECVLSNEPDFRDQPSGLEEIYMKHNNDNDTKHKCIFLPKFHPELNPIERCWSKIMN